MGFFDKIKSIISRKEKKVTEVEVEKKVTEEKSEEVEEEVFDDIVKVKDYYSTGRNYIEEKIGRLDKYFDHPDDVTATVVVKIRGKEQIVEVTGREFGDYTDIRDSSVYDSDWDNTSSSSWESSSSSSSSDDWDSDSDWGSSDSWDSGGTDWGSDW